MSGQTGTRRRSRKVNALRSPGTARNAAETRPDTVAASYSFRAEARPRQSGLANRIHDPVVSQNAALSTYNSVGHPPQGVEAAGLRGSSRPKSC